MVSRSAARWLKADGPGALAIVRIAVGAVFVSEGIQKFLYSGELGVGRFAKIGIPSPEVLAPFVGALEIAGGAALVIGLLSRIVSVPLLFNMLVAIASTKLVTLAKNGVAKTAHEARTDVLMIAGLLLILALGPGWRSLDAWIISARRNG